MVACSGWCLPCCRLFDRDLAKGVAKGDLNPHTLKPFATTKPHTTTTSTATEADTELVKQQQEYLAQFSKGLPQTTTLDKFVTSSRRPSQGKRSSSSSSMHLPVSQKAKSEFRQPKLGAGSQSSSTPRQEDGVAQHVEIKSKYFGSVSSQNPAKQAPASTGMSQDYGITFKRHAV